MDTPDQLHEMFQMQKAFNERGGMHDARLTEEERIEWLSEHSQAVTRSIAELTNGFPWQWLVQHQGLDARSAHAEVIDLFHLAISLAQVLGMGANDVFEGYVKRNAVSLRQQEGDCSQDERLRHILRGKSCH
jgi:dimeric dUTPase (all-alpha-NTP-PPase superfamily)